MGQEKKQEQLFDLALQVIGSAAQLPFVRVEREDFLRQQFKGDKYLDVILERGPQAVYEVDSLRKKADRIIKNMTNQVAMGAFVLGLPANPLLALPLASADVVQFFGYALNLAQQLAYLYGEDNLFDHQGGELPEEAKHRIIVYLGIMFGTSGASSLLPTVAKRAGEVMGKRVARQALMKTAWYPILKKVGSSIGVKVTKKGLQKGIEKAIPLIGGALGGGLTYVTFKPMGQNLSKTFIENLNGGFTDEMALRPEFLAELSEALDQEIADAEFVEKADQL